MQDKMHFLRVEILDIVVLMYRHQKRGRKSQCLKAIAIPPCLDGDTNFWHFYRKFEVFSIIQIVLLQDKSINPWGQYEPILCLTKRMKPLYSFLNRVTHLPYGSRYVISDCSVAWQKTRGLIVSEMMRSTFSLLFFV